MDYLNRGIAASTLSVVGAQLKTEKWREEEIPLEVTGLDRAIRVIRGPRLPKKSIFTYDWHGDKDTFCPPKWWDLAIGAGACGLGCRSCFLMLTHRAMNDPMRHRLYDNVEDYPDIVGCWLLASEWPHPNRAGQMVKLDKHTTLGLGIDRSDSLLYEGVTGHARRLIPLFVDPACNPQGRKLILLTKSANTHYLDYYSVIRPGVTQEEWQRFYAVCAVYRQEGFTIPNVAVTFSVNPDQVADKWEGKWPDTLTRITPHMDRRLEAAWFAQRWGFCVRWRLDPILPIAGWREIYRAWLEDAVDRFDAQPQYITLGSYREKNDQLDFWRARWGLPAMEYQPEGLTADGTHFHLSHEARAEIYSTIRQMIVEVWTSRRRPVPAVSLCKESNALRRELWLCNAECNCLQ